MRVEKLKLFIELYESRNYTKTAKRNYISQAALSQYVSSLENQFNAVFFDRSVSPIQPTPIGTLFYEQAQVLYTQYLTMVDTIEAEMTNKSLPLRIGYTAPLDVQCLLPYIPELIARDPDIDVKPIKISIDDAQTYLEKNVCDVVVSFRKLEPTPEIHALPFHSGKYYCMVNHKHPLATRESASAQEIYEYPVSILSDHALGNYKDYMMSKLNDIGINPNVFSVKDNFESLILDVISNNSVSFVSDEQIDSVINKYVTILPLNDGTHTYTITLYYSSSNKHRKLDTLLDVIKSNM
jgi:DNA-binding transcriptional LysR family regulator